MINIVLLEPQIPQNTGNIARTCAATGSRLHLVKPMGFTVDDKKLKRAGLDYWHLLDITYYDSTREFFEKNKGEMFFFTTKGQKIYSDEVYRDGCYLIFGREDRGINEKILAANYDRCVRFPMLDDAAARSLNLSNSVAIAVYEALRQQGFGSLRTRGELTGREEPDIL